MTTVTVQGSKNDFEFGPDQLEIPALMTPLDEAAAVVDAILQSDDPDGTELSLPPGQREQRSVDKTPRERAVESGFTALLYRRSDGSVVQII